MLVDSRFDNEREPGRLIGAPNARFPDHVFENFLRNRIAGKSTYVRRRSFAKAILSNGCIRSPNRMFVIGEDLRRLWR